MKINTLSPLKNFSATLHVVGAAISLILLIVPLVFLSSPYARGHRELEIQLKQTQQFLKDEQKFRDENRHASLELAALERRREEILARIPNHPNESEFLAQVAKSAKRCGLKVVEFRPGKVTQHEKFSEMEVGFQAQGGYASLCHFLHGLDSLSRYCLLSDLDIDAMAGPDEMPIQMKLRIFFNDNQLAKTFVDTPARDISETAGYTQLSHENRVLSLRQDAFLTN